VKLDEIIPQGYYCYKRISNDWEINAEGTPFFRIELCPFWRRMRGYHEQESGFCIYLQYGDWGKHGGLLWDQVKSCNVNYGMTDEEKEELEKYFEEVK